ncbi:MAG: hypothetical protein AAFX99_11275 [Myxococcota bacterium]
MSETNSIWEYIHGYAPIDNPNSLTFFDEQDQTLYRDVSLKTIGLHGWELVTVLTSPKGNRYEYFFKRDRAKGYATGLGLQDTDN